VRFKVTSPFGMKIRVSDAIFDQSLAGGPGNSVQLLRRDQLDFISLQKSYAYR
jgi:hypothetical protein